MAVSKMTTRSSGRTGSPNSGSLITSGQDPALGSTDIDKDKDRLKMLYPFVNEAETPLPRAWSTKDKYNFIGLTMNNLRVHYKGHGKGHKDAASVRAAQCIPAACGIYYFEVKIISKGRDGYMGIGLSAHGVNMNRLPGWDKHSYGYHGDDGHSFCSSGTGQPYGPTFTTGDVIGCGVNLVDNTCFYTKNGHHLGVAFTDLPPNMYPTVGLQTPGEIVDANFGQSPFVFDVEDMMKEYKSKTKATINKYVIPEAYRNWEAIMNRMVMSYLVHHGYCSTAEAFAKTCGQVVAEDLASMQNRQKIQKLVLEGHISEAEEETKILYPDLLDSNPDLLFMLRCRHFVELVGNSMKRKGPNDDPDSSHGREKRTCNGHNAGGDGDWHRGKNSSDMQVAEQQYTNGFRNGSCGDDKMEIDSSFGNGKKHRPTHPNIVDSPSSSSTDSSEEMDEMASGSPHWNQNGSTVAMDQMPHKSCSYPSKRQSQSSTAPISHSGSTAHNGYSAVEELLQVGRELQSLSVSMRRVYGHNEPNKKLLENVFSLLAYADPWKSPVGWQLSPRQREPVCAALNSAILQSIQLPRTPPLQVALNHAHLLLRELGVAGLGACAFADLDMQADIK